MQKIQFICTICLNQLTDPTCLSCGHTFCEKCVNQHLKINHTCPLCRKPTLPDWPINEMLKEALAIYTEQGEEVLRTEFPQIILCLDCGLTPVNPIVLPCQHLFCYQCYQNDLQQQYCPVCMQQCMITDPIVNIMFSQLLQWYCETDEKIVYEDMKRECMPIFLFDKQICYKRNYSLRIVEERYKNLIKFASHGSGKFPIVPFTDKLPIYADMVEIQSITDCIEIVGTDRLIISQIYCFINDQKIPFTPNTFKALPKQLWLCDYQLVKDNQDKSTNWNKIKQFLSYCHSEMSQEMKAIFDKPFQLMNIFTNKINNLNQSLILIQLLRINNYQFQKLYYSNDENARNQFIWNFMNQIQQKIINMLGNQVDIVKAKGGQMIEQELQLPNLQYANIFEEDEEDEEDFQELTNQFSNMTLTQKVILNLFHLHRIPLFQ